MKIRYELWPEEHERYDEFVKILEAIVPKQLPFVTGPYFKDHENFAFMALFDSRILGFIRYCRQPIGLEAKCPVVKFKEEVLWEAKINAFAVLPDFRNKGIGKALQKIVITHAKEQSCYQVTSYSTFDKAENYSVKLSLGYGIQPETQADGTKGSYFVIPLSNWEPDSTISWDVPDDSMG